MADLPKYYSGLINIEAQDGATVTLGNINHYTSNGDVKTYDFSHLVPAFNALDENGADLYLKTLELPYVPIKNSFILVLDGMILSASESVNPEIQAAAAPLIIGDYRFIDDKTIEFLFEDGLKAQSALDTPVLLARYARS